MDPPNEAPPWLAVFTAEERPDLWQCAETERVFEALWPEYNQHGLHAARYFGALVPRFAHLQALFVDERMEQVVARARSIPFSWDGTLEDLPVGIDGVGLRAVASSRAPNALSALAAEVRPEWQGTGLSGLVIATMATMARRSGFSALVAPVRPTWKDRFPLAAIGDYASWQRHDGLPYDPWIRVHARLGARILRPEPNSMEFAAPVADWEAWTGMRLPYDGNYIFPKGLAPLMVARDVGRYWEPNVWMLHEVSS